MCEKEKNKLDHHQGNSMVCTLIKHSSPPKKRLHIVHTEKGFFFGFFLLHYVM